MQNGAVCAHQCAAIFDIAGNVYKRLWTIEEIGRCSNATRRYYHDGHDDNNNRFDARSACHFGRPCRRVMYMPGVLGEMLRVWMLLRRIIRWLLSCLRIVGNGALVAWPLRKLAGGRICVGGGRP